MESGEGLTRTMSIIMHDAVIVLCTARTRCRKWLGEARGGKDGRGGANPVVKEMAGVVNVFLGEVGRRRKLTAPRDSHADTGSSTQLKRNRPSKCGLVEEWWNAFHRNTESCS
jgi:hypothetical protein